MTPKERRARLFKKDRPHIRPLESKDMGWLWAAYKAGSFKFAEGLTQEEFTQHIMVGMAPVNYLVEDNNAKFASGRGPVGLIGVVSTGRQIEPFAAIFKWATARNILRGSVAFFQWVKSSREIGECVVRVSAKDKLMRRMVDYEVLYPRSMETVYGVRGKRARVV